MIEYKVIKKLEMNPAHTQRTLAKRLDVSLGKGNYVLSGLIEKGFVKAKKLKNHPDKIRWMYILTPKGIQEKVCITKEYLRTRLREFDLLQKEIQELEQDAKQQNP